MKKRRQNSRASKAGVDPRAIEQAAELLVRAIAQAMQTQQQPRQALPKKQKSPRTDWSGISDFRAARRRAVERERRAVERAKQKPLRGVASIAPTPAPATRAEALKIAARLYTLGRACSDLSLPLQLAGGWLPLADLGSFADRAEEHLRALVELYRKALAENSEALKRCDGDRTDLSITLEVDAAEKELGRLRKIADGSAVLDIGRGYIPPEFRLASDHGFMEGLPDDDSEGDDSPL